MADAAGGGEVEQARLQQSRTRVPSEARLVLGKADVHRLLLGDARLWLPPTRR